MAVHLLNNMNKIYWHIAELEKLNNIKLSKIYR